MEGITRQMEYWQRLFWICLFLSLLCLVVAVVLFFTLHIRTVLEELIRLPVGKRMSGKSLRMDERPVGGAIRGNFVLEREIKMIHTREELRKR